MFLKLKRFLCPLWLFLPFFLALFACAPKTVNPTLPTWPFVNDLTFSQTRDPVVDCYKAKEGEGICLQGLESAMFWDNKAEEGTYLYYWPATSDMDQMRRQFPNVEKSYALLGSLFKSEKLWTQTELEGVLRTLDQCTFQSCEKLAQHADFRLPMSHQGRLFSVLVTAEAGASTKHIQLFAVVQRQLRAKSDSGTNEYLLISSPGFPIPSHITKQCLAERQRRLAKGEKEDVPKPIQHMETWPFERECYHRVLPDSPELNAEVAKRRALWPEQFRLKSPQK